LIEWALTTSEETWLLGVSYCQTEQASPICTKAVVHNKIYIL